MKAEIIDKDIIRLEAELSGKADGLTDKQFDKMIDNLYEDINEWAFQNTLWELMDQYLESEHPELPEMVEMKKNVEQLERAIFEAGLNKREGWPV